MVEWGGAEFAVTTSPPPPPHPSALSSLLSCSVYHIHFQINVLRGYCWARRYTPWLGFEHRRSILPLRSARVYIALPYIKPCIFMHSVPVAVLTAEERGEATRSPKGREQPHSPPLIFITVDLLRLNLSPAPLGTETLYVLISVGNKDFLLS